MRSQILKLDLITAKWRLDTNPLHFKKCLVKCHILLKSSDNMPRRCVQVKKIFPYAMLIGRRHPIVKFTQGSLEMEISSFSTGSQGGLPDDAAALLAKVAVASVVPVKFDQLSLISLATYGLSSSFPFHLLLQTKSDRV